MQFLSFRLLCFSRISVPYMVFKILKNLDGRNSEIRIKILILSGNVDRFEVMEYKLLGHCYVMVRETH